VDSFPADKKDFSCPKCKDQV